MTECYCPANTALALILLGGAGSLGTFLILGVAYCSAMFWQILFRPVALGVDVVLFKAVLARWFVQLGQVVLTLAPKWIKFCKVCVGRLWYVEKDLIGVPGTVKMFNRLSFIKTWERWIFSHRIFNAVLGVHYLTRFARITSISFLFCARSLFL